MKKKVCLLSQILCFSMIFAMLAVPQKCLAKQESEFRLDNFTYDSKAYARHVACRIKVDVTSTEKLGLTLFKSVPKGTTYGSVVIRSYYLLDIDNSVGHEKMDTIAFEAQVIPYYLSGSNNNAKGFMEKMILGFNTKDRESRLILPASVDVPSLSVTATDTKATSTTLKFGIGYSNKGTTDKKGKVIGNTKEQAVNVDADLGFTWENSISNTVQFCINGVGYQPISNDSDGLAKWSYDYKAPEIYNKCNADSKKKVAVDDYFLSESYQSGQITFKGTNLKSATGLHVGFSYDIRFGGCTVEKWNGVEKNTIFEKKNSTEIVSTKSYLYFSY